MSKDNKTLAEIVPKDVFIELDRSDEQQIVLQAMGEVAGELFYEVHGTKRLSLEGINSIAYIMGDVEVDPWVEWERIELFGDRVYWSATVRARNNRFNLSSLGTAEAPELQEIYDRDERNQRIPIPNMKGKFRTHLEQDEFCRRKALGKAQRNAKRSVMPTVVLKKWLQYFTDIKLYQKGTRRQKPEMPFKPKNVDAEYQVLNTDESKEPPPEEPPIEKPTDETVSAEKPKGETPQGPPESIEDVRERIADFIAGSDTLLVVSDRGEYFRVGKRKTLDSEIEDHVDMILTNMGGTWDKDANCWKIPKGAKG